MLTRHAHESSQVYLGHSRTYFVYRPHSQDPSAPAALMVFQDGDQYLGADHHPVLPVIDNLISRGELPGNVVCVFVNPGKKPGEPSMTTMADYLLTGRCEEYDVCDDRYARFLVEELLPHAEAHAQVRLSRNPRLRMLCGFSSGGVCALNAAFLRSDAFGIVLSHCGSFTAVRDGHTLAYRVRVATPSTWPVKRVFLQSGTHDLCIGAGDWLLANKVMEAALAFGGFEHRVAWGEGGHTLWHGTAILPEALQWLWHGWQADCDAGAGTESSRTHV
jgi:enterochelin esterase-like enzyme